MPAKRADTALSSLLFRCCLLAKSDGHRVLALVERLCSRCVFAFLLLSGFRIHLDRAQPADLGLSRAAPGCAEPRFAQAGRWFCVNTLAAMLALQFMLPLYPQAKLYFDFVSSQGFVSGWQWVRNTVAYMIGGAPGRKAVSHGPATRNGLRATSKIQFFSWGSVGHHTRRVGCVSPALAKLALGDVRLCHGDLPADHLYGRVLSGNSCSMRITSSIRFLA